MIFRVIGVGFGRRLLNKTAIYAAPKPSTQAGRKNPLINFILQEGVPAVPGRP